ncbi:hypothetical protein JXA48_02115 [Candidatus Woesearchaeota archaeon]|nr:hypothetical protein [Candidatus Woesearchaeota archaeon]
MSFKKKIIEIFKPTKLKLIITGIFFILFLISFLVFPPIIKNYIDAQIVFTEKINEIKQINDKIEIQPNPDIVSSLEKQKTEIWTKLNQNATKIANKVVFLTDLNYPYVELKLFKLNVFPIPCEMSLLFNYEYVLDEARCTFQVTPEEKATKLILKIEADSKSSFVMLGSNKIPEVKEGKYSFQIINYIVSTVAIYLFLSIIFIFRKKQN